MIVARQAKKLKLGDGATFDTTRLKELPQENETWEADFEALPKPFTQNERHHLDMVITKTDGSILAAMQVKGSPTVDDMATMLANAMLFPLTADAHRPSRIYVREHTPWDEVYSHLREIGIKVSLPALVIPVALVVPARPATPLLPGCHRPFLPVGLTGRLCLYQGFIPATSF